MAATVPVSGAAGGHGGGGGWRPYRTTPFVDKAGQVCRFGVRGTPVYDREQYRTLATYHNGHPRLQEYRGPLFVRYTNLSTGRSVVRNLSGYGFFWFARSGGFRALILSHIGVTVPVGNRAWAPGEWVIDGVATVIVHATGQISIDVYRGHAEDLCRTLS